jgi:hypothetical protein
LLQLLQVSPAYLCVRMEPLEVGLVPSLRKPTTAPLRTRRRMDTTLLHRDQSERGIAKVPYGLLRAGARGLIIRVAKTKSSQSERPK